MNQGSDIFTDDNSIFCLFVQETEGAGRGGEGAEEGREAAKARAEDAGEGGEEEPEEGEAAAGGGAEEAADEDRHGGEEAAAGSAQPGIDSAHCRAAGQSQGTACTQIYTKDLRMGTHMSHAYIK